MPYIDIDIDVEDFVSNCNKHDIKNLIEVLIDDGHLPPEILNKNGDVKKEIIRKTVGEIEFEEKLDILKTKYFSLSLEDESELKRIFSKYL